MTAFWIGYAIISAALGLVVAVIFVNDEKAMKGETAPFVVALFHGMWLAVAAAWPLALVYMIALIFIGITKRLFGPLPPKDPR